MTSFFCYAVCMKDGTVGIDEAGRGPLAGPMVLAGVMDIDAKLLKGIRDSKKLSPRARDVWYSLIKKHGIAQYVSISARRVDEKGISRCARGGIAALLKKFPKRPARVLMDGNLYAPPEYRQRTIIKGDEKIPLIAAASVIAKVTRDRYMVRIAKKYPKYNFEIHKGYGTPAHMRAIRKHGLSNIHRESFCKKLA